MVRLFSTFSPCAFVSNPMEKRVERFGYEVTFNPRGDGDFFYASAAKALGIETQGLKNVIFDFLKSHQFDASVLLIANSRTTKISLLCQLAAIFTGIFGQNSQKLEMVILQYPISLGGTWQLEIFDLKITLVSSAILHG